MIFLDLPNINGKGTPEQQLAEIRSYIYKNNEQINTALSNLTIDKIWEQTASAVSSAGQSEDKTPKILKQYQRIRDLIIKTADVVAQSDEKMEMAFNGSYLAKSQFGEYLRNTSVEIDGSSTGFTELYRYSSRIGTDYTEYKLDFENYIKRGLLGEDDGAPVYGIEVGLLSDSIIVDGEEKSTGNRLRTRMTPSEMSFWEGSTKVAYINSGHIWFPKANITGGSININNKFIVSSTGKMTATSGTFGGTLDASKLSIRNSVANAWNSKNNDRIVLETLNNTPSLSIYSEIDNVDQRVFNLSEDGIDFYKRYAGVDDVMAKLHRETYGEGHWGISMSLRRNFGEFFAVKSYDEGVSGSGRYGLVCVPIALSTPEAPFDNPGIYLGSPLRILYTNQSNLNIIETAIRYEVLQIPYANGMGEVDGNGITTITIHNGIITGITFAQ